jgi:O-Antigen ligase
MFKIPRRKVKVIDPDFTLTDLSHAEKLLYWAIVLTPLWWVTGVQTLVFPLLTLYLIVKGCDLDKLTKGSLPLCNWAWLGMSIAAFWTSLFGLDAMGFSPMKAAATVFTVLKGYFLIFGCMTLPFWYPIRVKVITRAVVWLSIGYLVTLFIQIIILFGTGPQKGILPPLAKAIPGDKLSLMVKFAIIQPFAGIPLPRTELYTADPPILGVCAFLCFFICLGETNKRLRKYALAGASASLIIAQSRLAWMCFPLTNLIINSFRSRLPREGTLWLATFVSFLSAILGLTVNDLISKPLETFNSARADSSKDREFVVSATIEAWKESPWIGWGVIDKTVSWGNGAFTLPLGTFSSYSQVLYLHGIVGFVFFALALVSTLLIFLEKSLQGNILCQRAFGSLIGLYLLCQATTLTWMAIYFWFYFIWLGAIIVETHKKTASDWSKLSTNNK